VLFLNELRKPERKVMFNIASMVNSEKAVVTATKTSAGTVSGFAASGVDEDVSEGDDQSRMALQSGVAAEQMANPLPVMFSGLPP